MSVTELNWANNSSETPQINTEFYQLGGGGGVIPHDMWRASLYFQKAPPAGIYHLDIPTPYAGICFHPFCCMVNIWSLPLLWVALLNHIPYAGTGKGWAFGVHELHVHKGKALLVVAGCLSSIPVDMLRGYDWEYHGDQGKRMTPFREIPWKPWKSGILENDPPFKIPVTPLCLDQCRTRIALQKQLFSRNLKVEPGVLHGICLQTCCNNQKHYWTHQHTTRRSLSQFIVRCS
jgi:hypothetical protein